MRIPLPALLVRIDAVLDRIKDTKLPHDRALLEAELEDLRNQVAEHLQITRIPPPKELCKEAVMGLPGYFPCNRPAVAIVGWEGRNDTPIPMCEMCREHNVVNRGGYVVRRLS